MGKKAVNLYFRLVMLIMQVVIFVFTLMGLYGGDSLPANSIFSAALTFVLPGLIVANIVLLIYWLFRRPLFMIIPLVALGCTYRYVGTMLQFRSAPKAGVVQLEGLTVATYNVRLFNKESNGLLATDIKKMMMVEGVDVLCLQEFQDRVDNNARHVTQSYSDVFPYSARGRDDMIIFSRYPITASRAFPFEYSNNSFMWADVKVDEKTTVRVFNVHMETTGINSTLHRQAKMLAAEGDTLAPQFTVNNTGLYEALLGNYVFSLHVRSGQSILVANEKIKSPNPIILCGDFNDVPYSYTYNTLLGNLQDGFREGGHGFMFTYRGARGLFRIDYVFHDPAFQSEDYYTLDRDYSDHNPVISRLKIR